MNVLRISGGWHATRTVPATAGWIEYQEKCNDGGCLSVFGARSLKRLASRSTDYPVNTLTLAGVVWFICHIGKGKACSAIMWMELVPLWNRRYGRMIRIFFERLPCKMARFASGALGAQVDCQ